MSFISPFVRNLRQTLKNSYKIVFCSYSSSTLRLEANLTTIHRAYNLFSFHVERDGVGEVALTMKERFYLWSSLRDKNIAMGKLREFNRRQLRK